MSGQTESELELSKAFNIPGSAIQFLKRNVQNLDLVSFNVLQAPRHSVNSTIVHIIIAEEAGHPDIVIKVVDCNSANQPLHTAIEEEARSIKVCDALSLPVPRLIAADFNGGWLMTEYIRGESLHEALAPHPQRRTNVSVDQDRVNILNKLGQTIGLFHRRLEVAIGKYVRLSLASLLDRQQKNIEALHNKPHLDQTTLTKLSHEISFLNRNRPSEDYFTLCHGDLSGRNIILNPENTMYLLDWQEAKVMPPALEIAFLTSEANGLCLDRDEEKIILAGYMGENRDIFEDYQFYKALDNVDQAVNALSNGFHRDWFRHSIGINELRSSL